jgi:hypothetical protein
VLSWVLDLVQCWQSTQSGIGSATERRVSFVRSRLYGRHWLPSPRSKIEVPTFTPNIDKSSLNNRLYLIDINSPPYLNNGPNSTTDASAFTLFHASSNYPAHHGWVRDDTVDHGVTIDLADETEERVLDRVSPKHQTCLCFSWGVDDSGFIICSSLSTIGKYLG